MNQLFSLCNSFFQGLFLLICKNSLHIVDDNLSAPQASRHHSIIWCPSFQRYPPVPVWVAPFPGLLWKTISNLSLFDTYHTGTCQYLRTEGTITPPPSPGYSPGPQVPSLFTHPWTGSRQTSSFSCSGLVPTPGCQAPHLISTLR